MIYIEFHEDKPIGQVAEKIDGFDIRSFKSKTTFLNKYPDFIFPVRSNNGLDQYKREAILRVSKKADEYQEKVVGTNDSARFERFKVNLKAAKAYLNDTATSEQASCLNIQLITNKAVGHPVIVDFDLKQFAEWIVSFEKVTILGSAYIESVLIEGSVRINAAESKDEVDNIISELSVKSEEKFNELMKDI